MFMFSSQALNSSSMASPFTPPPPPPLPPPSLAKSGLPMLYYGLIVVGTAAVILALYNLIVLRWCADRRSRQSPAPARPNTVVEIATSRTRAENVLVLPSSFKYKKEMSAAGGSGGELECAVCLSAFEEGEEIRKLPRCRHCFHAPCIDMWLHSHSDCPLCRTPVVSNGRRCQPQVAPPEESSRDTFLGSAVSV